MLIIAGTLLTAIFGYLIYRSISNAVERLTTTMRQISAGNLEARVELKGRNELAELGDNFDRMVEERIATQAKIDRDHQQLNQSVSDLLDAVFDLSERNLTVRAKVTEDATGPLADAINQLAEDTAEVLKQVRDIAVSVETASQDVNRYALSVNEMAQIEQAEAEAVKDAGADRYGGDVTLSEGEQGRSGQGETGGTGVDAPTQVAPRPAVGEQSAADHPGKTRAGDDNRGQRLGDLAGQRRIC